jgi:hypothetical protein
MDDDDEYDFNGEVASEVQDDDTGSCVGLSTENRYDNSRHNNHTTNKEISLKNNQCKPCKSSSVARSASKMSKKQKRSTFQESDGFNAMLMAIAHKKKATVESNARYQKENAKVDKVVGLMEKWGRACEAIGS